MCFFKKTNKKIQELQEKVDKLTSLIENEEYKKLKRIEENYATQKELIQHIKIKLKSVRTILDENTGEKSILVKYEIPDVVVRFDNGKPIKENTFYAINSLELISFEDMKKIHLEIEKNNLFN